MEVSIYPNQVMSSVTTIGDCAGVDDEGGDKAGELHPCGILSLV